MTSQIATQKNSQTKQLTGRHVLLMLVAFFGVIISVNIIFITQAVSSFTGEDVKQSYRQGLEYNKTIQTRSEQASLGWNVTTNVISSSEKKQHYIIQMFDEHNLPIQNLDISGTFKRPTNLAKDEEVVFTERGNGIYEAQINLPKGQWQLKASAQSQAKSFRFESLFEIS